VPLADLPLATGTTMLPLSVLLTAFSNGCTALTGVEAVSNGVPAFRPPESRNAAQTLVAMAAMSIAMFVGITLLAHAYGIVPNDRETVVSQIARATFGGRGVPYYLVQAGMVLRWRRQRAAGWRTSAVVNGFGAVVTGVVLVIVAVTKSAEGACCTTSMRCSSRGRCCSGRTWWSRACRFTWERPRPRHPERYGKPVAPSMIHSSPVPLPNGAVEGGVPPRHVCSNVMCRRRTMPVTGSD
jgi:hypothetical protein